MICQRNKKAPCGVLWVKSQCDFIYLIPHSTREPPRLIGHFLASTSDRLAANKANTVNPTITNFSLIFALMSFVSDMFFLSVPLNHMLHDLDCQWFFKSFSQKKRHSIS